MNRYLKTLGYELNEFTNYVPDLRSESPDSSYEINALELRIKFGGMTESAKTRLCEVSVRWPDLCQAIVAGRIPAVPFSLGRDSEGLLWDTLDLATYGRYAVDSFVHVRGASHIDAEPEERAVFRLDLVAAAVAQLVQEIAA